MLTTLSRGVLYVFDPQGNFLWVRRLGVDTHRLPLHMPATTISPAALMAVSTEDNTLLSLDAENEGRVLWQYQAGEDMSSPLTIVNVPGGRNQPDKQRGLLPTADGNIHVLELVLGKQLGRFKTGQPLADVGGGYDPRNQAGLLSGRQPPRLRHQYAGHRGFGESSRPARPYCSPSMPAARCAASRRSLTTYLILSEATDLERMSLQIFGLTEPRLADPRSKPIDRR